MPGVCARCCARKPRSTTSPLAVGERHRRRLAGDRLRAAHPAGEEDVGGGGGVAWRGPGAPSRRPGSAVSNASASSWKTATAPGSPSVTGWPGATSARRSEPGDREVGGRARAAFRTGQRELVDHVLGRGRERHERSALLDELLERRGALLLEAARVLGRAARGSSASRPRRACGLPVAIDLLASRRVARSRRRRRSACPRGRPCCRGSSARSRTARGRSASSPRPSRRAHGL